ncbi:rab-GTPase-TBC domain-containing protein [Radiomyces spectabilis]|uniref:rab-GTPase-TBC domain-containing protein n=1 Tax=Radiomyces spectabilis TaxID=64574 RepID=UPI0022210C4D|nr:rab-GTPase-TBC domain-containing protein [Radiomyces spectabilis]KAI8379569.1 rab-GTPase-TBC domain-containing protein [Radiomyces spectabilis]
MLQLSSQPTALDSVQRNSTRSGNANMQYDEAESVFNDFSEILQSEVYVDLERLRLLARHGIPRQLRGEVWKYLLGVEEADRSKELTSSRARSEEYHQIDKVQPEIGKRIRGELSRYQRRTPELSGNFFARKMENVITAYLTTNRDADYHPALIPLCAPFIYTMEHEYDAYHCFDHLMRAIDEYYTQNPIKECMAQFMSLFRYVLPDLCNYFEEEEVDLNEWVTSWLQNLLSKEMTFDNLVRLWDSYFSIPDPFDLHPFICLAILRNVRENLEDLEQSEIRTMLLRLPAMDMQRILADGQNIQHETMERQMFEDAEDL